MWDIDRIGHWRFKTLEEQKIILMEKGLPRKPVLQLMILQTWLPGRLQYGMVYVVLTNVCNSLRDANHSIGDAFHVIRQAWRM